jgi:D-3-phosphoglycerate dehydrogenase
MARILISDAIANEGVEVLKSHAGVDVDVKRGLKPHELIEILENYEALIVRSETKVTPEVIKAGKQLQVIARAGIGVDNIDLDAATNMGIAVVNAPTGNTIAAAEHTLALMLALARNLPQAHQSLKQGQWSRSAFMGIEVRNKTLGIIGLGRVGSEVARRAQGFAMHIVAYDPFVTPDYARILGVELLPLRDLLAQSDFVTVHTPLTDTTSHLIGAPELAIMKPGSRIINVARGELIDEDALLEALEEGTLAGVALDVFSHEPPDQTPLLKHPKVVVTPHLGASTEEAQREVAVEAAEQVMAVLRGEPARNTVNAPFLPPEVHAVVAPYLSVASLLGKLLTSLAEGQFVGMNISYQGEMAQYDTSMLKSSVLAGLLASVSSERVNLISAPIIAQQRGLKVTEQKSVAVQEYGNLITATLETTAGSISLGGTSMRNEVHIVRVNDYWMDMVPSVPYLLFVEQQDKPGSIGAVGMVTGKNDINISFMVVGRMSPRGEAMMIVGLDDPVPPRVLEEIRAIRQIESARLVRL